MNNRNSLLRYLVRTASLIGRLFAIFGLYGLGAAIMLVTFEGLVVCAYCLLMTVASGVVFSLLGVAAIFLEIAVTALVLGFGLCGFQAFRAANHIVTTEPVRVDTDCHLPQNDSMLRGASRPVTVYQNELLRPLVEYNPPEDQLLRGSSKFARRNQDEWELE